MTEEPQQEPNNPTPPPTEGMDIQKNAAAVASDVTADKREREETEEETENDDASKKQKLEDDSKKEKSGRVELGPKVFVSVVEMFDYFYKLLHHWPPYVTVNKYESLVLLDLLKKGHAEPHKKIGGGVKAFQIRNHPVWKSRCYFLMREDGSVDDFSFRKCVDHIIPLPEDLKVKPNSNRAPGGGGGGRGHGGRGGRRGRGGRGRH